MDLRNKKQQPPTFFGVSDVSGGHDSPNVFLLWQVLLESHGLHCDLVWKRSVAVAPIFSGGPGETHGEDFPKRFSEDPWEMFFSTQCFGTAPHPVTVTTRMIPFLVGNPSKPSFVTVSGWGVDRNNVSLPFRNPTFLF